MNVYTTPIGDIFESRIERLIASKLRFDFVTRPLETLRMVNQYVWGREDTKLASMLLFGLSTISTSGAYAIAVQQTIEAALWHSNREVVEGAALALITWNDASAIHCLIQAQKVHPDSEAIKMAIEMLHASL